MTYEVEVNNGDGEIQVSYEDTSAKEAPVQEAKSKEVATNEIPDWMKIDFFQDIIDKVYVKETCQVQDMQVNFATNKGDNYASIMYRTKFTIKTESDDEIFPVIVKALPNMGLAEEIMKEFNVFPKEIEMYSKVIPSFEEIYREFGETIQFGPKCFKAATAPTDILVLEDLSARGYKMADRQKGLDIKHTERVLEKLAKFHAGGAVQYEREGPYSQKFDEGMYSSKMEKIYDDMYDNHFGVFLSIVRSWPFGKEYADIMNNWKPYIFNAIMDTVKVDESDFNVLLHGDMWCNNFMYKYDDEGDIADVLLVDYQMCFWGSPAIDLNYFLFSSVNSEIKLSHLDYFIKYYHDQLIANLKLLQYQKKLPTLKQLQMDILRRGLYALITCTNILPLLLMDATEEASMDTMMRNDEVGIAFKHKMYNSKRYIAAMKELFPYFTRKGLMNL